MANIALHFSPQPTRSSRARWALEEAGIEYEPHPVDVFKGEHKQPEYLRVNPMGLVPTMVVDGAPTAESAAITLWAAAAAPEAGLGADPSSPEWTQLLQWVVYGPAELDHYLATLVTHTRFRPPEARNAELVSETLESLDKRAQRVADALEGRPFLLGERFTVADVSVGHAVAWAALLDVLSRYPTLVAYLERLEQRPAFQRVYGPKISVFPDPHAS